LLHQYLPVLVFAALGILVGGAFATLNMVLGPKKPRSLKSAAAKRQSDPYECGLPSEISKSFRFGISFYLVAMLFILFDIEIIFFYPWAVAFRELGWGGFVAMLSFTGILVAGFVWVWKKGALEWETMDK